MGGGYIDVMGSAGGAQAYPASQPQGFGSRDPQRPPLGALSSSSTTGPSAAAAQEKENDALVRALISDVRRTKESFLKMGSEVKKQNAILDSLERAFDGARGALSRVMSRLDRASGASSFSHMWALFIFVILVFMFIYALLKFRR